LRASEDLNNRNFQLGSADQIKDDCSVVLGAGAASKRRKANSKLSCRDEGSCGLAAAFPRGKSLNKNLGTPQYSTISLAAPITTVEIPAASKNLANKL
jgi:hypothetical protein